MPTPAPPPPRLVPPASYAALDTRDVKVSHVPESSATPTPVILITINRPAKHNAFTDRTRQDLERIYALVDIDPRVKCVVMTGAGKSFCAGFDLEVGFPGARDGSGEVKNIKKEQEGEHRDSGGRATLAIHQCSKPTIVAINGAAVGVGITMCLPAAIRVAYAKAKIGFVFSRRGLVMEACSSFFLPRLIGYSRAMLLTTTGAVYPADSPHFGGLFAEVLPTPEATLARAIEMADDVAKNTSIVSIKMNRDMMFRGPDSAEAAHLLDSKIINGLYGSKDNLEGVESFLQKRAARFTGTLPEDGPLAYPWWSPVDIGVKYPEESSEKAKL